MTTAEITITAENIEQMKDQLPGDQARELAIGCRTWGVTYAGSCRGQITVWPNGRGAVCLGGDSVWGDWGNNAQLLYTEDYDESGRSIAYTTDGEQVALDADGKPVEITL